MSNLEGLLEASLVSTPVGVSCSSSLRFMIAVSCDIRPRVRTNLEDFELPRVLDF